MKITSEYKISYLTTAYLKPDRIQSKMNVLLDRNSRGILQKIRCVIERIFGMQGYMVIRAIQHLLEDHSKDIKYLTPGQRGNLVNNLRAIGKHASLSSKQELKAQRIIGRIERMQLSDLCLPISK